MSNTLVTILTSSVITAGLLPLCNWLVKHLAERQARNATIAQTITAAAGSVADDLRKENERISAARSWFRTRLRVVLQELLRVDPNNEVGKRVQREHDEYDEYDSQ